MDSTFPKGISAKEKFELVSPCPFPIMLTIKRHALIETNDIWSLESVLKNDQKTRLL